MTKSICTFTRVAAVFISLFAFLIQMSVVFLFARDKWRRVRIANRVMTLYCRWGLWLLNVRVNKSGAANLAKSGLLVGNHLSYLDVLLICAQTPTCFVTSKEIKETPFLGLICQMAGCLFVERRNKDNLQKEISEICEGLRRDLNITIFPEATSTNGEQILRFRKPLFTASVYSLRPVIPFCINYRRVGGQPIDTKNRDSVMWYGDMPFAPHLWALASNGSVEADLHFLPPVAAAFRDQAMLAETSRAVVERVFRPVSKHSPDPILTASDC